MYIHTYENVSRESAAARCCCRRPPPQRTTQPASHREPRPRSTFCLSMRQPGDQSPHRSLKTCFSRSSCSRGSRRSSFYTPRPGGARARRSRASCVLARTMCVGNTCVFVGRMSYVVTRWAHARRECVWCVCLCVPALLCAPRHSCASTLGGDVVVIINIIVVVVVIIGTGRCLCRCCCWYGFCVCVSVCERCGIGIICWCCCTLRQRRRLALSRTFEYSA